MDLFSIACTTCKSRLKVREASAIGQILACPKCGGMVLVKAPDGWKKGEPLPVPMPQPAPAITTVVDVRHPDETLGDSNFDVVDDLLSDAPPKMRTPSSVSVAQDAPGLARPRFAGAPPGHPSPLVGASLDGVRATQSAASLDGECTTQSESLKPPPPGEANAIEPLPDFAPPRPWRYWAMMAGSVAAGIVLALAVVVGMIQFFKGDLQTIVLAGTTPLQPVTPTAAVTDPLTTSTAPETPAATPGTHPTSSDPVTSAVETAPLPPPAPMPPMPGIEQDPPGLVKPMPPPVAPANPNDPLAKFDLLLGGDDGPAKPDEAVPAPAPPPPATAADKPILPRPEPRAVNVTARLADALPGIETSGTPLADFLQFMSELTTIPMTLEPDGLPLVRATAESPVVLGGEDSRNTTVGAALAVALKPLGLEYVVDGDQLVVRLIEPAPLPALKYPIKDLAADEQQRADLAALLQAVIEPASWNSGGGEGTLTIDGTAGVLLIQQRRAVHAQLLIAFEKLRTARKLPYATGTRYNPGLFKLDTRLARAQARLETPISLNFSQPTPLVRILERLGKAGGVRILVDWQGIATAGWNPDGEATLLSDKQPLAAALDSLLTPMDLTWRIVDGQTIQVLTPEALASRIELEFFNVDGLVSGDPTGDALLTKLRSTLGPALFRESGGPGELHFDPAGQCLIASLPQPKQRELESLLAKWQSELPAK